MAGANFTQTERNRAQLVLREISVPALDRILRSGGVLSGIRERTVRDHFPSVMTAAVELLAAGAQPTDQAFAEYGGPSDDCVRRLFRCADLSDLPGAQLRTAMDALAVAPPQRVVFEAWTEPTKGPGKFGTVHLNPPPPLSGLVVRPLGSAHTTGGIATAIALAECGEVVIPYGDVPIQQGHWLPSAWSGVPNIESLLRDAGEFHGDGLEFRQSPEDVARGLIARMNSVERLCAWDVHFDGLVIAGGRLRTGYPRADSVEFGAGRENRYIGADLAALRELRDAGFVPFFELPQQTRSTGRGGAGSHQGCDWTFHIAGEKLDLKAVEALMYPLSAPWRTVAPTVMAGAAPPGIRAFRLGAPASTSSCEQIEVQLVMLVDSNARSDLYVTTMSVQAGDTAAEERLVRLAVQESGRQVPGSPIDEAVRRLVHDGWLQRNKRQRFPDRRSFAAVAQAAFGILEIARSGEVLTVA